MTAGTIVLLAALILVAAMLYSTVGHAGASGYLAAMALLNVEPSVMKPTALCLNVLVASIAAAQFARAGFFSWRLFWPFAAASIPAAFLGGTIALPGAYYRPLVGAVLIAAAFRLTFPGGAKTGRGIAPPNLFPQLAAGGSIGLLSGLTGTGGGIFLTPLLLFMGWAEQKQASGVSSVFILVNSIAGLAGLLTDFPRLPAAIPLWAAAAVCGGMVGSYYGSRRLQSSALRRLLAVVLAVAGAKFIAVVN